VWLTKKLIASLFLIEQIERAQVRDGGVFQCEVVTDDDVVASSPIEVRWLMRNWTKSYINIHWMMMTGGYWTTLYRFIVVGFHHQQLVIRVVASSSHNLAHPIIIIFLIRFFIFTLLSRYYCNAHTHINNHDESYNFFPSRLDVVEIFRICVNVFFVRTISSLSSFDIQEIKFVYSKNVQLDLTPQHDEERRGCKLQLLLVSRKLFTRINMCDF